MVLIRGRLCYRFPPTALSSFALRARFIALIFFARCRRWGRATTKRRRQTRPQRTAHGVRLSLPVCLDQGVKLALVLSDVLLLLPVEGLCLAALGLEVGQGQRNRVLGVQGRVSTWVWMVGEGKGQRAHLLLVSGEERADGKAAATQTLITS